MFIKYILYYINKYYCYYVIIVIATTTTTTTIFFKVNSSVMTAEVDGLSSPLHPLICLDRCKSQPPTTGPSH